MAAASPIRQLFRFLALAHHGAGGCCDGLCSCGVGGIVWFFVDHWWIAIPTAVFFAGALLLALAGFRANAKIPSFNIEKMGELGRDCESLATKIAEFNRDRYQSEPGFSGPDEGSYARMNEGSRHQRVTLSDFERDFSGPLESVSFLLRHHYNISCPSNFVDGSYYYSHNMVRFLSAVGSMLRNGHLEEAQKWSAEFVAEASRDD